MTAVAPAPARVIRLAASGVTPEQLQRVVAGLLAEGAEATPGQVVDALEHRLRRAGRLAGREATERAGRAVRRAGARVLVAGDAGYPDRLAQLWPQLGAPLWLFVRGAELPTGLAVAVVGTRTPSLDGLRSARELAGLCALHGVAVISGMARGIDQAAHRGALDGGGLSTAVLGAGFDVDYPGGSARLRQAVEGSAGLVSELLPATPPRPAAFLRRNRLISGLADVCVVVEGRSRSGAVHTAGLAAAQGREVCAVPGSPHQPTAQAPLALIRDGARILTRPEDLLDVLAELPGAADVGGAAMAPQGPGGAAALVSVAGGATLGGTLGGTLGRVHKLLGPTPATAGQVAAALGASPAGVLAALAELQERGMAHLTPRGYVRGLPVS